MKRFDLDPVFAERKGSEVAYDRSNFVEFFTLLANAMGLSLRARERCITRLRVVMDQTPSNHYLDPSLVALLIVLRSNNAALFNSVISGEASADTVMKFLVSLPGGKEFQTGRPGIVIHAYLLAADNDHDRAKDLDDQLRNDVENDKLSEDARRRASDLLEMKRHISGGMRMGVSLAPVAAKIDLAAMVRE